MLNEILRKIKTWNVLDKRLVMEFECYGPVTQKFGSKIRTVCIEEIKAKFYCAPVAVFNFNNLVPFNGTN